MKSCMVTSCDSNSFLKVLFLKVNYIFLINFPEGEL